MDSIRVRVRSRGRDGTKTVRTYRRTYEHLVGSFFLLFSLIILLLPCVQTTNFNRLMLRTGAKIDLQQSMRRRRTPSQKLQQSPSNKLSATLIQIYFKKNAPNCSNTPSNIDLIIPSRFGPKDSVCLESREELN